MAQTRIGRALVVRLLAGTEATCRASRGGAAARDVSVFSLRQGLCRRLQPAPSLELAAVLGGVCRGRRVVAWAGCVSRRVSGLVVLLVHWADAPDFLPPPVWPRPGDGPSGRYMCPYVVKDAEKALEAYKNKSVGGHVVNVEHTDYGGWK